MERTIDFGKLTDWNIEETTGYKPISTFYTDLGIAEWFGARAIKETYRNVEKEWGKDYKMFTEFVMALNWKCWEMFYKGDNEYGQLYHDLYYKGRAYALNHYKGDALKYYIKTTD